MKPSGLLTNASPIWWTTSTATPVVSGSPTAWSISPLAGETMPVAPVSAACVSANAISRRFWKSAFALSYSSSVMSPRPTRASVYRRRTERFASMRFVMSGCVIDGSSPSL